MAGLGLLNGGTNWGARFSLKNPHSPFRETTPYDRRQQPVVYLHVSSRLRFASQDGSRAHSTVTHRPILQYYRKVIGIMLNNFHNSVGMGQDSTVFP